VPNALRSAPTGQACQAAGLLAQPAREPDGKGPDYKPKTPAFFPAAAADWSGFKSGSGTGRRQLAHLRCKLLTSPVGIDATALRLSWDLSSAGRGLEQTAYQPLVASMPERLAADEGDL